MKSFDPKAGKFVGVERENLADAMHVRERHGRHRLFEKRRHIGALRADAEPRLDTHDAAL